MSRILSGERKPTPETLQAFARALKLPIETIYRAAGLLPPADKIDEKIRNIEHSVAGLSEDDQRDVLEYVRMKVRLAEERGKYKTGAGDRKRASAAEDG